MNCSRPSRRRVSRKSMSEPGSTTTSMQKRRQLRAMPSSMPWTEDDEAPVVTKEMASIRRLIEESTAADELSRAPEIKSDTLDLLAKYSIIAPANLRYFKRVFDTFDLDKVHLLDFQQVRIEPLLSCVAM